MSKGLIHTKQKCHLYVDGLTSGISPKANKMEDYGEHVLKCI